MNQRAIKMKINLKTNKINFVKNMKKHKNKTQKR